MSDEFKKRFGIPDLDFSKLKPLSGDDAAAFIARIDKGISRDERLAFIEHIEAHPEDLIAWDMPFTFDEYARRVRY